MVGKEEVEPRIGYRGRYLGFGETNTETIPHIVCYPQRNTASNNSRAPCRPSFSQILCKA
jgi:hypothetical protein